MNHDSFNIIQPFVKAALAFPFKTALIQGNQKISYNTLYEKIQQKAAYFTQCGIKKGDRVLVFIPMSIDLYITVLALFYMGATAVFVDEWVNRERLAICCKMAGCKGFIAPAKMRILALTSKAIRKIPVWLNINKYSHEKIQPVPVNNTDTALITFTTGSTGIPKAANRTHAFLYEQFKALLREIDPNPGDTGLTTLPIVLLLNLGTGCTSVIPSVSASKPESTDFGQIAKEIITHKVNRLESSPDFAMRLAKYITDKKMELSELKKLFTGGAPVFPKDAAFLQSAFKNTIVNIVYGSTEAEPVSVIDAKNLSMAPITNGLPVGKIHHGTRVRIIPITGQYLNFESGESFEKFALKNGEVGEIVVSGAHVLTGYIDNAEAEKQNKIWVNGSCWHRTGDSGTLDAAGNLYLHGRATMVFEHRGITHYPFMAERIIKESGIAVIGTLMPINNQVIVFAEGNMADREKLKQHLNSRGLRFDRLVMLKKIPRDKRHFSKIEYSVLKNLL